MLEIFNVRPINKGNIVASCSVYVKPWDLEINDVIIFQQGVNKWVAFPRKKFENSSGETKYTDYFVFRDGSKMVRFRKMVVDQIEEYVQKHGSLEPESPIKDEPNPFEIGDFL